MPSRRPCAKTNKELELHEMLELRRDSWTYKSSWSFEKGVALGVDVKLPRTAAVYERKLKRRKYPEQYEELGEEDFRLNYPSARQAEETIEAQFAREVDTSPRART